MTELSDSVLVAFVDGELDAAAAERVNAALKHDQAAEKKVRLVRSSGGLRGAAPPRPATAPRNHEQAAENKVRLLRRSPELLRAASPEPAADEFVMAAAPMAV